MRQCKLTHRNDNLVAWIDVEVKDKGRYIDIDGKDWLIESVGHSFLTKHETSDRSQDYKNMRKVTDI